MSREHTPDHDKTPVTGQSDTSYKRMTPQSGVIDPKRDTPTKPSEAGLTGPRVFEIPKVEHPKVVGRWKVLNSLGEGGMGTVFRAQHEVMDKVAAVKFLHPQLMSSGQALVRFQREARAANQLNHPNVVSVFDCGVTDDGWAFQVMEHIDGKSLSDVLKAESRLPLKRACKIFIQICDALYHAHNKNVIHRDLKPSNVMLLADKTHADTVKIVDFGIAKVLNADAGGDSVQFAGLTAKGQVFGSPHYMSPEQCMAAEIDARSDVYAMGCLMYETLSGLPPFMGNSYLETMTAQIKQETPHLVSPQIPDRERPKIESIVRRALEKDRNLRYQSMDELKVDLENLLAQIDSEFKRKETAAVPRSWILAGAAMVLVLTAAAASIGFYANRSQQQPEKKSPVGSASHADPLAKLDTTQNKVVWFIWPRPYAQPKVSPKDYGITLELIRAGRKQAVAQANLIVKTNESADGACDLLEDGVKSFAAFQRETGHYAEAAEAYGYGYEACRKLFPKLEKMSKDQLASDRRLAYLRSEEAYCHYMLANQARGQQKKVASGETLRELRIAKQKYAESFPILLRFSRPLEQGDLDRHLMVAAEINLELGDFAAADAYLTKVVEKALQNGSRSPRREFVGVWAHAQCIRGDLQKMFKSRYSLFGDKLTSTERADLTGEAFYSNVKKELAYLGRNSSPRPDLVFRVLWLKGLNHEHQKEFKPAKQEIREAIKVLDSIAPTMRDDQLATLTALICRDQARVLTEQQPGVSAEAESKRQNLISLFTERAIKASKKYNLESVWWKPKATNESE